MKTVFLRVLEAEDKATALFDAIREPTRASECAAIPLCILGQRSS
jgi:hypothetical protein